uniref:Uncharacterized protein n=1 Tax=Picea sitchensis TaxID=3332 RepID=A9NZC4_PICSI|nr:unknown [Picea sitchensis]
MTISVIVQTELTNQEHRPVRKENFTAEMWGMHLFYYSHLG